MGPCFARNFVGLRNRTPCFTETIELISGGAFMLQLSRALPLFWGPFRNPNLQDIEDFLTASGSRNGIQNLEDLFFLGDEGRGPFYNDVPQHKPCLPSLVPYQLARPRFKAQRHLGERCGHRPQAWHANLTPLRLLLRASKALLQYLCLIMVLVILRA